MSPRALPDRSAVRRRELALPVLVDSNVIRRIDGDAGALQGFFTGANHEGAADTLERTDLTAAFGATRR